MTWKPITLALFSQYQQCLQAKGIPDPYLDEIGECFQSTFAEPVDPPDPPDPPTGTCLDGFHMERWLGQDACVDEPDKFSNEPNGVSVMGTNANAYWPMSPVGGQTRGSAAVEVFYRTAQIPQDTGGGHLFTAESGERPYDPNHPKGWFRPDIVSKHSVWYIDTYNLDGNGDRWYLRNGQPDAVVDLWSTGIPHAGVGKWIPIKIEWERRATDKMWLKFTASGQSREKIITIHPQSKNPRGVGFGNQDGLGQFGGTPQIAFRNFVWS
jgi:hypothetical protein